MAAVSITNTDVVLASGSTSQGTAGEAISAGHWVAFDTDDGLLYKAENSDDTRSAVVGIAVSEAVAADQPLVYATPGSRVDVGSVGAAGDVLYLGDDGVADDDFSTISSTDQVVICGIMVDADTVHVTAVAPGIAKA
jgi:hypothetical protein